MQDRAAPVTGRWSPNVEGGLRGWSACSRWCSWGPAACPPGHRPARRARGCSLGRGLAGGSPLDVREGSRPFPHQVQQPNLRTGEQGSRAHGHIFKA